MHNRIAKDNFLKKEYFDFMSTYEELAHMRKVKFDSIKAHLSDYYFIPHHGVWQHGKKLRVVFNASFKDANGISLNSSLHSGPPLQTDLTFVLMRWRCFQFVFKADIQKMYRQILLHPDDRKYQCILWGNDPNNYDIYELSTVTYGIVPSACQAISCLRQLAILEGDKFPLASKLIDKNMYVDDAHFGADNLSDAVQISKQFVQLLNAGDFPLRKWAANDQSLLSHFPEDWLDEIVDSQVSCLGMSWNNKNDTLSYVKVYNDNSRYWYKF